ncbi:hypothetical protein OFO03_03405 [Campylobacter sp. JMF_02 ED1]|uniref:hypothetical protein n=1 Tax=unclassified Campylobacter TaxID=2593542 RepID=UPI0022E9D540|nr:MULTISPECIES: hypothetical protein [unclassified Campylobacter]MDA3049985.1 hypothetical protein [Campylobacter sp. JMF_15 NE4]MDA3050943.1 hypothetical protein [Campylobacter sp. JMF_02 ED1]
MLNAKQLKMWQNVSKHLSKMSDDTQYRAQVEARLYKGIAPEIIDKIYSQIPCQNSVNLISQITKLDFSHNEFLAKIQTDAINLASNFTAYILENYAKFADSAHGRYICSDTFKELFMAWVRKNDRALVNDALHNTSAVLGATQFDEILKSREESKTEAVFITGIPGAGKSASVKNFMSNPDIKLIFEGQLANPAPSIAKIEKCLQNGLNVTICVLHIAPERALKNTFARFEAYGRGSSIAVMSSIQGNLGTGLAHIAERFADKINIIAIDRDRGNEVVQGFAQVQNLINIGSKDEIFTRLRAKLNSDFENGKISEECFNQADKTNLMNIMRSGEK